MINAAMGGSRRGAGSRALAPFAAVWLALSACTPYAGPNVSPAAGGPTWIELASSHFTLQTDLSEKAAVEVVAELEQTQELLKSAICRSDSAQALHTHVVAFRSIDELRPFVGDGIAGIYNERFQTAAGFEPLLMLSEELSPFSRTLFAHELAHRITFLELGGLDRWLAEGLAQYYSTIRGEAGNPIVGEPDPENVVAPGASLSAPGDVVVHGGYFHISELPRASQLIAYDAAAFYAAPSESQTQLNYEQQRTRARNYATSWMLVHLLFHGQTSYAAQFREAYGYPGRSGARLQALVAEVSPQTLDQDLISHMGQPLPWHRRYLNLAPAQKELKQRTMTNDEVTDLWGNLRSMHTQG